MKKIVFILTAFMLVSCSDENAKLSGNDSKDSKSLNKVNNKISSTEDYYNFLNPQTKDFIMIEDLRNLQGDVIENNIYSQSREASPLGLLINNKDLSNDIKQATTLSYWNNTFEPKSFFNGSFVTADIAKGKISLSSTSQSSDETYIPKQMVVKVLVGEDGIVKPGTLVSWESDERNENGVVVGIEYNAKDQSNPDIAAQNVKDIRRFSTIEDNGSYKITEDDLSNFPKGANLTFYVSRIGKIVKANEALKREASVNFYTAVRGDFPTKY